MLPLPQLFLESSKYRSLSRIFEFSVLEIRKQNETLMSCSNLIFFHRLKELNMIGEEIEREEERVTQNTQTEPTTQAQLTKRITANQKDKQERQARIKKYCEQGKSIAGMAQSENVSETTIKRDLKDLGLTTH
jgi:DNA-binding NarL/FixJ family response regulator